MTRPLPALAVALLILPSVAGFSIEPGAAPAGDVPSRAQILDSSQVRRWQEDLGFLAREMPARHANLFHTASRARFDSALSSIRDRLPSSARHQVVVELERLAAMIADGHTNVCPWRDTVVAFHTLPIALHRFGHEYFIRAATLEHASLLGARVTRIGPIPIAAAESLVAPRLGRQNAMAIRIYAPQQHGHPQVLHALGMARDPGRAELGLEIGGRSRTVALTADGPFPNLSGDMDKSWDVRPEWVDVRGRSPAPLWLSRTGETCWFTHVPDGRMLYCQINQIQERGETFEAFFARALSAADSVGAERFVLDLRLNGGGNGYYNRAIVRALLRSRFDERGRLFVVTGRRTFSAAQMLISDLEKWTHPIFVGEPSASRGNAYGDSRRLVLPNNRVTVRVSTLWWQYWDPRETRPWIAPDIAAPLTVAAYRAGRDPALEAIARHVPGPLLADRLKPQLLAGDSTAAWGALEAFRADPANAWLDPGESLDLASAVLQSEGRREAAMLAERLRARLPAWSIPR